MAQKDDFFETESEFDDFFDEGFSDKEGQGLSAFMEEEIDSEDDKDEEEQNREENSSFNQPEQEETVAEKETEESKEEKNEEDSCERYNTLADDVVVEEKIPDQDNMRDFQKLNQYSASTKETIDIDKKNMEQVFLSVVLIALTLIIVFFCIKNSETGSVPKKRYVAGKIYNQVSVTVKRIDENTVIVHLDNNGDETVKLNARGIYLMENGEAPDNISQINDAKMFGDAIYKNESCEAELHFACSIQGKHLIIESISDAEHDAWDCKTLIE